MFWSSNTEYIDKTLMEHGSIFHLQVYRPGNRNFRWAVGHTVQTSFTAWRNRPKYLDLQSYYRIVFPQLFPMVQMVSYTLPCRCFLSLALRIHQREKNLPIMPPATFRARPPVFNALPAKFDAWPNLSHLENASVFVTVKLNAITRNYQHLPYHIQTTQTYRQESTKLTRS